MIDELYYYEKYKQEGKIEETEDEKEISKAIRTILAIMDTYTVEEFKEKLKTKEKDMASFNFNVILEQTSQKLKQLSKQDIVQELGKTHKMLEQMKSGSIHYEGQNIPVKRLQGEGFILAITTIMPHCSSTRKKMALNQEEQKNIVLDRPVNPYNKCATLISNEMLGHAMSEFQEDELIYGYVPIQNSQISFCGKYDLLTVGAKNQKGEKRRVNQRSTQNRTTKDLIATTTEEHNEVVFNEIYPNYIVCFDRISEIALQKYKCLMKQYKKEGIDQKIEILLVEGKEKYFPQIEEKLEKTMSEIEQEIENEQTISRTTMEQFFNKRERNLVLQTLQAINSTSYRDELWNPDRNKEKMDRLINLLDEVATLVPEEYVGEFMTQVEFLLSKATCKRGKFYDHCFSNSMNNPKLNKIQRRLEDRLDDTSSIANEQEEKSLS